MKGTSLVKSKGMLGLLLTVESILAQSIGASDAEAVAVRCASNDWSIVAPFSLMGTGLLDAVMAVAPAAAFGASLLDNGGLLVAVAKAFTVRPSFALLESAFSSLNRNRLFGSNWATTVFGTSNRAFMVTIGESLDNNLAIAATVITFLTLAFAFADLLTAVATTTLDDRTAFSTSAFTASVRSADSSPSIFAQGTMTATA